MSLKNSKFKSVVLFSKQRQRTLHQNQNQKVSYHTVLLIQPTQAPSGSIVSTCLGHTHRRDRQIKNQTLNHWIYPSYTYPILKKVSSWFHSVHWLIDTFSPIQSRSHLQTHREWTIYPSVRPVLDIKAISHHAHSRDCGGWIQILRPPHRHRRVSHSDFQPELSQSPINLQPLNLSPSKSLTL